MPAGCQGANSAALMWSLRVKRLPAMGPPVQGWEGQPCRNSFELVTGS